LVIAQNTADNVWNWVIQKKDNIQERVQELENKVIQQPESFLGRLSRAVKIVKGGKLKNRNYFAEPANTVVHISK